MSLRKKPGNGTASDIHTGEFILSNAIPMAVLTLNERSQLWVVTMNIWGEKKFLSKLTVLQKYILSVWPNIEIVSSNKNEIVLIIWCP